MTHPASSRPLHLTDKGLVGGDESLFARMCGNSSARRLALDDDRDRLLAMLSVLADRPLDAKLVLPPIAAAADYWHRGDKVLANLRLIFSRLPKPSDQAAVDRLRKAEALLTDGLPPAALMRALWPPTPIVSRAYDPDEPRIPAGHGTESGRWTFANDEGANGETGASHRVRIAEVDEPDLVDGNNLVPRHDSVEHDAAAPTGFGGHHRIHVFDPLIGLPAGVAKPPSLDAVVDAFRREIDFDGTRKRSRLRDGGSHAAQGEHQSAWGCCIHGEQSYLNGAVVDHGTKGSVRPDVVLGTKKEPNAIIDGKTGDAAITPYRMEQFRKHVPGGARLPIIEMKP